MGFERLKVEGRAEVKICSAKEGKILFVKPDKSLEKWRGKETGWGGRSRIVPGIVRERKKLWRTALRCAHGSAYIKTVLSGRKGRGEINPPARFRERANSRIDRKTLLGGTA